MKSGVLLFAHGARDQRWAAPFEAVADELRRLDPHLEVVLGFLEFMSPDLQTAGAALVASGCTHVDVVPLFLGAGGHVRKDLPMLMNAMREQHAEVAWQLQPAIGETDRVVRAMAQAALELAHGGEAAERS